jgi:hypothetical protein
LGFRAYRFIQAQTFWSPTTRSPANDIFSERKFPYPETKPDHFAGLPVGQQTECSLHHAMAAQDFLQLVVRYSRIGSIVGTNGHFRQGIGRRGLTAIADGLEKTNR